MFSKPTQKHREESKGGRSKPISKSPVRSFTKREHRFKIGDTTQFGNYRYICVNIAKSLAKADKFADDLRDKGYHARITPSSEEEILNDTKADLSKELFQDLNYEFCIWKGPRIVERQF